jgi:hypothetical protein
MTATRLEREQPIPENESPGAVPAAPGRDIPTRRQDKARKATLQVGIATENYAYSDCTHFPPQTTVDLLSDAIEHVRPMLVDESRPTKQRIHTAAAPPSSVMKSRRFTRSPAAGRASSPPELSPGRVTASPEMN